MKCNRIIFTAPIKALSNERYLDLKNMGLDVGIETGDFKKNIDAPILCCMQEIYTNKYANIPNNRVIIDEFHYITTDPIHYITTDPKRARAYIDGIIRTHKDSKLLAMSATFGEPAKVKQYLSRISGRKFTQYCTNQRATELIVVDNSII